MFVTTDENGRIKMLLFGLRLSNTMMKSTRLQIRTLSRVKLNSHFPRLWAPQAKAVVPRQTLPHSITGHPLGIPATPVTPTVPVVSTSGP